MYTKYDVIINANTVLVKELSPKRLILNTEILDILRSYEKKKYKILIIYTDDVPNVRMLLQSAVPGVSHKTLTLEDLPFGKIYFDTDVKRLKLMKKVCDEAIYFNINKDVPDEWIDLKISSENSLRDAIDYFCMLEREVYPILCLGDIGSGKTTAINPENN